MAASFRDSWRELVQELSVITEEGAFQGVLQSLNAMIYPIEGMNTQVSNRSKLYLR